MSLVVIGEWGLIVLVAIIGAVLVACVSIAAVAYHEVNLAKYAAERAHWEAEAERQLDPEEDDE